MLRVRRCAILHVIMSAVNHVPVHVGTDAEMHVQLLVVTFVQGVARFVITHVKQNVKIVLDILVSTWELVPLI